MTVFEQAQRYLAAIPPSISGQGGHVQALNAARALKWGFNLPDSEAMQLLQEWNQTCLPPWSHADLDHKLREADSKDFGKPRGYLLTGRTDRPNRPMPASPRGDPVKTELPKLEYDLSEAPVFELPDALPNGFEKVLRSCFGPGEGVRVMSGITEDGTVGCDPHGGVVLSREEWLARLEERGDINSFYSRQGGPPVGVYLGINPMRQDGRGRDADVVVYRHVLLEFDEISLEEQWLLYTKSKLPCAAIIYSGNKSLHAWVKIYAKDRKEFDERVNLVYNHFAAYKPDPHNKNPSRFSRCPDAKRGDGYQLLMAIDTGVASFTEWSKHLLVQGIGQTYGSRQILEYNAQDDGLTVAGHHWLRKGGSAILVGPSGIGKSSLGRQLAMAWALGRPCMGITPARALKVLMIQAENDLADMHDMDIGIARGLGVLEDQESLDQLDRNLITNQNVADTGHDFIVSLQRLVDHHQPDLVIVDPLLSFIGNDISKQEVVGQFCRNWLNPILSASNVAFLAIHHTGKPPKEFIPTRKNPRPVKSMAEWAYHGIGSSELTNWARAIMVLNPIGGGGLDGSYELLLAKRGARAHAVHPDGIPTTTIYLAHSLEGIYWIQVNPPQECASASEAIAPAELPPEVFPTAQSKVRAIASGNIHEFLAGCLPDGEKGKDIRPRLQTYAGNVLGIDINGGTVTRALTALVGNGKLARKGSLYIKGPNA
jgi:hypothetical protein